MALGVSGGPTMARTVSRTAVGRRTDVGFLDRSEATSAAHVENGQMGTRADRETRL